MKMCSGLGRVVLINKNKINKLTEWQTEGWTDGQIKNNLTPHLATWGVISVVVPERKLWWDKASNPWLQKKQGLQMLNNFDQKRLSEPEQVS